jgi:hypothetical protein
MRKLRVGKVKLSKVIQLASRRSRTQTQPCEDRAKCNVCVHACILIIKKRLQQDIVIVIHICNASLRMLKQKDLEFEAALAT